MPGAPVSTGPAGQFPLLSTAFCPPIEYFALLAEYSSVYMEACESYAKQSWRNRCRILSANGPLDFTVPVIHSAAAGLPSADVSLPLDPTADAVPPLTQSGVPENVPIFGVHTRVARSAEGSPAASRRITAVLVDYSTPWTAKFKRAVESAYYSSPFYIYYKDALWAILDERPATLWELNHRILDFFCARIGIAPEIIATTDYFPAAASEDLPSTGLDYREAIHPKRPNHILADRGLARPYWQVFRDRFGFVPGLSILDLLFNEGPESICWLIR